MLEISRFPLGVIVNASDKLDRAVGGGRINCPPSTPDQLIRDLFELFGWSDESTSLDFHTARRKAADILQSLYGGAHHPEFPEGDGPSKRIIGRWGGQEVTLRDRIGQELATNLGAGKAFDHQAWASVPDFYLAWADMMLEEMTRDVATVGRELWTHAEIKIDVSRLQANVAERLIAKLTAKYALFGAV